MHKIKEGAAIVVGAVRLFAVFLALAALPAILTAGFDYLTGTL